jgi:hypothetical protein
VKSITLMRAVSRGVFVAVVIFRNGFDGTGEP